uniref:Uncharacterized protein n=1 Tax=Timema douglasi TaxID=61478 RepID=A0A7R8VNJ8_TIMDO|nr:unnamed protein product [Timema douglasi]
MTRQRESYPQSSFEMQAVSHNNQALFVNDIENEIANNAFDVALKYLQRNTDIDIQPDVTRVTGNSTDAREFLDQLCKVYNDSLEEKKAPHVVIDTTIAGVPSEVVKAFTSALGLPTLSASHGQDGDLRNNHLFPSFILAMMFKESSPRDGSFPSHTFITVLVLGQHNSIIKNCMTPSYCVLSVYRQLRVLLQMNRCMSTTKTAIKRLLGEGSVLSTVRPEDHEQDDVGMGKVVPVHIWVQGKNPIS